MNRYSTTLCTVLATFVLGACTEGTQSTQTGGSAGDTDSTTDAISLIAPLVGTYALPANWAGTPESEAYLQIQQPDNDGKAQAVLYRIETGRNCLEQNTSSGEVTKDPVEQRVFLDRLFELEDSVLSRSGNTLNITLSEDFQDVNNNGDRTEAVTLRADVFAADLPETCE